MAITKKWDDLFARYTRRHLNVAFLRALAKRESNMNPRESNWPAYGLLQVVPVVRESFNRRFGTDYSHNRLLDPEINVKVATELLDRIVAQYGAMHSDPNMQKDWGNPEFVKLVVAGWNSGYSEKGGVGKVASYLEQRGIPVTHDNVFRYAAAAGATRHLQNDTKYNWQRSVSDLYFAQPDRPSGKRMLFALGVFAGLGYLAWRVIA